MSSLALPDLDAATEAALRASIERFGVLCPVLVDQYGEVVDGSNRIRLAVELGVSYEMQSVKISDDPVERAEALASLNDARRQRMTVEQRRLVVGTLRAEGHSQRAIAGALGVSKTQVTRDLAEVVLPDHLPETTTGQDGKTYPAKKAAPEPEQKPDRRSRKARRPDSTATFIPKHGRDMLDANAQKRRLTEGFAEIEGICRGMTDVDFGMALAVMDADERATFVKHANAITRSLSTINKRLKEASRNGEHP